MFADVEAVGILAVVPVEAVPVRTVAKTSGWAPAAARFAAADVLLTVDDAIGAAVSPTQALDTRVIRRLLRLLEPPVQRHPPGLWGSVSILPLGAAETGRGVLLQARGRKRKGWSDHEGLPSVRGDRRAARLVDHIQRLLSTLQINGNLRRRTRARPGPRCPRTCPAIHGFTRIQTPPVRQGFQQEVGNACGRAKRLDRARPDSARQHLRL